jgi:hypothetical protein
MTDPISMVHFLEAVKWSAEHLCHDLCVLGDIAVSASVRMPRFEEQDVTSIDVSSQLWSKRSEWLTCS